MARYELDNLYFKDAGHKKRLLELLLIDNTHAEDRERLSLFYIVSSDLDTYNKFNKYLYDFQENWIIPEGLSEVDLSSSQKKLVHMGFNLYNNYNNSEQQITMLDVFNGLDSDNFKVAIEGIKIRFNQE